MIRKGVVVANKVFDLGLVELEKAVDNSGGKLRPMEIEVAGIVFQLGLDRRERTIMLNWWGLTEFPNIVWTRFVFLRFSKHPVRKVECFTYAKEA